MHTLKHEFKAFFENDVYKPDSGLIRFVATHTTYFKVRKETAKLNTWLEKEGAKTVDQCIEFLKEKP